MFRNDQLTRLEFRPPQHTQTFSLFDCFLLVVTNITIFIRARPILIDMSRLQIKLSRRNAAYPLSWKTEELTRIHLLQVMNGPPVPPAATYPSAGEADDRKDRAAAVAAVWGVENSPFRSNKVLSVIIQNYLVIEASRRRFGACFFSFFLISG